MVEQAAGSRQCNRPLRRPVPSARRAGGSISSRMSSEATGTLDRPLSIAPMMDWTEESCILIGYEAACALRVHQEIQDDPKSPKICKLIT
jgi:hypothetical protein